MQLHGHQGDCEDSMTPAMRSTRLPAKSAHAWEEECCCQHHPYTQLTAHSRFTLTDDQHTSSSRLGIQELGLTNVLVMRTIGVIPRSTILRYKQTGLASPSHLRMPHNLTRTLTSLQLHNHSHWAYQQGALASLDSSPV